MFKEVLTTAVKLIESLPDTVEGRLLADWAHYFFAESLGFSYARLGEIPGYETFKYYQELDDGSPAEYAVALRDWVEECIYDVETYKTRKTGRLNNVNLA